MREIDYDAALARVGGDKELLAELAGLFVEEYPQLLAAVRAGLRSSNGSAVSAAAHQLKGLLAQFSAERARQEAHRLEKAGKEGTLGEAAEAFTELEYLMEKLRPELGSISGAI